MNYFDTIKTILLKYSHLGKENLIDGTLLIGKAPHIAPYAWLHKIFPVLNENEVLSIEKEIKIVLPDCYKDFLLHYSNGLKIFIDTLHLEGLRKKPGRSIEAAWQPYSIFTRNISERIKDAKSYHFFIGGYNWDGSLLYIDTNTNKVHRCSRTSVKPLNTWTNFEEMLVSETERIASLFDGNGVEKDEEKPTTP